MAKLSANRGLIVFRKIAVQEILQMIETWKIAENAYTILEK